MESQPSLRDTPFSYTWDPDCTSDPLSFLVVSIPVTSGLCNPTHEKRQRTLHCCQFVQLLQFYYTMVISTRDRVLGGHRHMCNGFTLLTPGGPGNPPGLVGPTVGPAKVKYSTSLVLLGE